MSIVLRIEQIFKNRYVALEPFVQPTRPRLKI
jgi:hypothetical protein